MSEDRLPPIPPTDLESQPPPWPRQLLALFRRSPALWILPALPLLLAACALPSSWQTELRPGFSHARAFVPAKLALVWCVVGAAVYWSTLLAERLGLTGSSPSLRFPNGVGEFDKKIVHIACLGLAFCVTYGAPLWLLLR